MEAVAEQESTPARWIVIDDASTDGTRRATGVARAEVPFLDLRGAAADTPHAAARDRLARAAAPRIFNVGLSGVDWHAYTHIMKLDGDIELAPDYLRVLLDRFAANSRLGLAGGVLVEPTPEGSALPIAIPRHHVHGAVKCYSRECLIAIGGVQERLGGTQSMRPTLVCAGSSTTTFDDLVSVHHRPWGSADGAIRGRVRLGECAYITQYPPLWIALRSVKLGVRQRPRGIMGMAYVFGYLRAALLRRERVRDPAYRRFIRSELRGRMIDFAISGRDRSVVAAGSVRSGVSLGLSKEKT